jgi:sugar diacid utilization regulator
VEEAYGHAEETGNIRVIRVTEDQESYGIILRKNTAKDKSEVNEIEECIALFDHIKEDKKVRVFHVIGIDGIEGAGDGLRLIGETSAFVESIFPYKRVFSKYELVLVSNCIYIQITGGQLKKNYMDLLEPFRKEGSNKARQLLETLETFVLDAGMNSAKTSEFLDVHTNTVQYRLKKINEILGAEITGNRVIPGLTVALALRRLENGNNR